MRVLAIVLGSIWFFPVSCVVGTVAGTEIVAKLDERVVARGDEIHPLFSVAAEPGEEGKPFIVLGQHALARYQKSAGAGKAEPSLSFRLSAPTGSMKVGDDGSGATFSYRVLEDNGQEQLIELVAAAGDGDNTVWSRYRATTSTVVPVSSRMFYFGYMFSALFNAFIGAWGIYVIGRWLRAKYAASAEPAADS